MPDIDRMLQQAVRQLEAEGRQLDQRIAAIRAVVGDGAATPARARPTRRGMSPAARREVSRRMKAYWAKRRAGKAAAASGGQAGSKKKASTTAKANRKAARGTAKRKRSGTGKARKSSKGAATAATA
jgi:hypothetical protein